MTEGWICPKCGRGVAPGVTHCDHGGTGGFGRYTLPSEWPQWQPWPNRTDTPLPPYPTIICKTPQLPWGRYSTGGCFRAADTTN